MIVVSGASGTVGRHVLSQLTALGHPVRALSRHPDAQPAAARPGLEWRAADPARPESLPAALHGATRLVLISPAHPDMVAHQRALVEAAQGAGVTRIAKLSGLGAGPAAPIRLAQAHHAIEERIAASGVAHSLVRPNLFMQVLLGQAGSIARDGVLYAPAGEGAISLIDARDVARVLVDEVLGAAPGRVVREITGPAALSYAQVAEQFGAVLGRRPRVADLPADAARAGMLGAGLDPWLAEAFVELFGVYRAGHGAAVLPRAEGEAPATSLATFLADHRDAFLSPS